ncbi:uncharacterized protein LOC140705663 [Pogona vitticeps]
MNRDGLRVYITDTLPYLKPDPTFISTNRAYTLHFETSRFLQHDHIPLRRFTECFCIKLFSSGISKGKQYEKCTVAMAPTEPFICMNKYSTCTLRRFTRRGIKLQILDSFLHRTTDEKQKQVYFCRKNTLAIS